ncbi:hypothetical protein H4582DRAFT_1815410 [Lactarius indigo]|nr:hypothetical protein H4582DRAFT_1815410 [Lactarius indigo]
MYGAITSEATVYHYQDPRTGQPFASLLPPDHPRMVCLQAGQHVPESRYGFLGVLAAIVWFPLGIGLCLLDRRVRCQRCGESLEDGLCRLTSDQHSAHCHHLSPSCSRASSNIFV